MLLHFSRKADTAGPLKETLSPGTQRKLKSSDGLLMADLALEPERLNYKSSAKTRVSLHRFPPELDEKQLGTGDRQPLERLTVTSDACPSPSYSQCLVPDSTQLSLFPESLSRRFNLLLPLKHIPPPHTHTPLGLGSRLSHRSGYQELPYSAGLSTLFLPTCVLRAAILPDRITSHSENRAGTRGAQLMCVG